MTTDMMNVRDFVEKARDADLLREIFGFAASGIWIWPIPFGRTAPFACRPRVLPPPMTER